MQTLTQAQEGRTHMHTPHLYGRRTRAHFTRVVALLAGTVIVAKETTMAASTQSSSATRPAVAQAPSRLVPDPRIEIAWKEFEQVHGGTWKIIWNETTGLPSLIHGAKSTPYAGDAAQAARAFLASNPTLFGLDDPAMSLAFQGSRPVKSYQRVQFGLRYKQLDVLETRFVLLVDRFGSVVHVTNDPWPVRLGSVIPSIDENTARASTLTAVKGKILTLDEAPRLVILPEGEGRLVYRGLPRLDHENIHYDVVVDAHSGEVLRARRLTQEYRTEPAPSTPLLQSQRAPISANQDAPSGRHGPASSPAVFGPGVDACDGEWQYSGPTGETTVTSTTTPGGMPSVRVRLGVGNVNDSVAGVQLPDFYGAGLKLLPCKEYRIRFTANVSTWDTYNDQARDPCIADFRDVFLANVNSDEFLWNVLTQKSTGNLSCEDAYSTMGVYPPGTTWQFGGAVAGQLCGTNKAMEFVYRESDSALKPYLTFGLDTALTASAPDDAAPSWGTIDVEIVGETQVFDPNPYADGVFWNPGSELDLDSEVPCTTYRTVTLSDFANQPEGELWHLDGEYVEIHEELEAPVNPRPQCRDSSFPVTRSCKVFEAVMCYYHLTRTMKYVEGLGYTLRLKPLKVDPHGLNGAGQSHFNPTGCPYLECELSACNAYLAFGNTGRNKAEDADIILHEYGHALQYDQSCGVYQGDANPTGFCNETAAMGEGFADYWAFSNTTDLVADGAWLFEWANALILETRRVDGWVQYPTDLSNDEHDNGLIWAGTLWDLYNAVGKSVADDVVLMSHSLVEANPTFLDGIRALIAADNLLYGGAHAVAILEAGASHGIIRKVDVSAVLSGEPAVGVPIVLTPTDENGTQSGMTPFVSYHGHGSQPRFTAPPTHFPQTTFHGWSVDGVLATTAYELVITTDDSYSVKARYAAERNQPPPHGQHP